MAKLPRISGFGLLSGFGIRAFGFSQRRQIWFLALLLVASVIFAYQPAWNAGFIWDDDDYVTHNPLLTAPDGLKQIWFSADSPSQYFPLTYTTFRAERALWGLNPAGYHWVNILLHAANALLVWRLLSRLKIPGAWLAAAIFALHPVNVESVAWITQLKNVQSLFFCLLALLAWVEFIDRGAKPEEGRARHSVRAGVREFQDGAHGVTRPTSTFGKPRRLGFYFLALIFFALALFSKTTACTLPAALLLILWLKRIPIKLSRVAQVVPFVALGVTMGLVSIWWERHHQGTVGEIYSMSLLERVLVASRAVWFYAGKLLWPANLTFNYPLWKISPADLFAYAWLIAGAGFCTAIYFARRIVGRSAEVAAVFFVATLSPLLGFVMLYTFRYTFVADHYQYMAMLGPAALAAAGISTLFNWKFEFRSPKPERNPNSEARNRPTSGSGAASDFGLGASFGFRISDFGFGRLALCCALLALLGVLTWRQSRMYTSLETLWQTTIERNPNSYMAHNNLGAVFLGQGRVDEAITRFQTALEIQPDHANAHGNLGNALLRQGRVDEALAHFQRALEIEPVAKSHSDLGFGLLQKGRVDEAIAHCRKALEMQPDFAEAHNNLGFILLQVGQLNEAIAHFETALKLQPDNADARYNLAISFFQSGRADEAITHFQKVLETQPGNAEVHNNLGWALLQSGRVDEAIARFQTVLKLQPDIALAHNNLAIALLRKRRARDAIAQYQSFLKLQPDHAHVLSDLAWVLATWPEATIRNGAQAIELTQRANQLSGGQEPMILRSLAAAYAEGGQFAEAVTTAQRALELADLQSDVALGDALRSQLKLYQAGAPFRDASVSATNREKPLGL